MGLGARRRRRERRQQQEDGCVLIPILVMAVVIWAMWNGAQEFFRMLSTFH
jgi:hypothetical protein